MRNIMRRQVSKVIRAFILPALEKFRAKAVSAAYETKTGSIADNMITVEDDTLTIRTTVTSDSAIRPSGAKFISITIRAMRQSTARSMRMITGFPPRTAAEILRRPLTFNPKKDMAFGYKVYVQYCDQNGKWYAPGRYRIRFFMPHLISLPLSFR